MTDGDQMTRKKDPVIEPEQYFHDTRPYTKEEIDRWAWQRRPHERENVPEQGEQVLFREQDFGPVVPAVVHDVMNMSGPPHDHWNRHGGLERERGPGIPDPHVWHWDDAERGYLLNDDPWPWVHVRVIRLDDHGRPLRDDDGNMILGEPRWCREARVRGSCGWLREGTRAHTGDYGEEQ